MDNSGFRIRRSGAIQYLTSALLDSAGIAHLFATRIGGVSAGAFRSLNVSYARRDETGSADRQENVLENYRRALGLISALPEQSVCATQVHSDQIRAELEGDAGRGVLPDRPILPGCDGLILNRPTKNVKALCVKTADCVPILFANPKTGRIAAVHAGWRGTVKNIAGQTAAMLARDGAGDVLAAIGPHIGKCCYEVGENVYESAALLFRSLFGGGYDVDGFFTPRFSSPPGGGAYFASLSEMNRALILRAGVKEENLSLCNICTCCAKNEKGEPLFFSHRASGGFSGTCLAAIALT